MEKFIKSKVLKLTMEEHTLTKIKEKFVINICTDNLIAILIFLISLLILHLLILLAITLSITQFNIVVLTIFLILTTPFLLYCIYDWVKSTWKLSREQIENE